MEPSVPARSLSSFFSSPSPTKPNLLVSPKNPLPPRIPYPLFSSALVQKDSQSSPKTPLVIRYQPNGPAPTPSPVESEKGRIGDVKRVTKETNVSVKLNLDGTGVADPNTGIPFLDHMLDQLAWHGPFDVHVKAIGGIHVDDNHTNEDVALAFGTALLQALGDRKGINRFGDFTASLDEALIHVSLLAGRNSHNIIEGTFKAFARALRQATECDRRHLGTVPSSKGVLSRS